MSMRHLLPAARTLAALLVLSSAAFAQRALDVAWSNDRLTVRAANAPLAEILDEISRLTGLEVVGRDKVAGRASAELTNEPLERALAALLDGVNYSIQSQPSAKGQPAKLIVRILSMAGSDPVPVKVIGPLQSIALDALAVEALTEYEEQVEADAEDDPDYYDDIEKEKREASRLAAEGAFGPAVSVASLAKLLDNYNDQVRLQAIKALGTRAMPEVLEHLVNTLGDEFWEVRNVAREILSAAKDPLSLQRVGLLLTEADEKEVQVDALRVLAARAQPESIAHLEAFLRSVPRDEPLLRSAAQQMLDELHARARTQHVTPR
jgi:hypothetical protein